MSPVTDARPQARRGKAAIGAIGISMAASATLLGTAELPASWAGTERLVPPEPATGPEMLWYQIAGLVPVAERLHAPDVLCVLVLLGIGAAATWVAYGLFRGPGRWWAAACAGPLCVSAVVHCLLEHGAPGFPDLPFALMATLAVGALARSLVHFGRLTSVACARVLAAGTAAAAIAPRPGVPLVSLLALSCLASAVHHLLGSQETAAGRLRFSRLSKQGLRRTVPVLVVGVLVPGLAVLALVAVGMDVELPSRTLGLGTPPVQELREHLGAAVLYPGLALVLLLVVPLRWRGGLALTALMVGGLTVRDEHGLLAPTSVLLVAAATAGTGWVWLAGSLAPHRRLGRMLAVLATVAVATFGTTPMWSKLGSAPLANERTQPSLVGLYERGLLAPGDVVIVQSGWLHDLLRAAQTVEGARPDVVFASASALDGPTLEVETTKWRTQNRRILSDSFNLGGRWRAEWAVDSGPLFWFVGDIDPGPREFTDLAQLAPRSESGLDPENARRWELFHVERARFRRAVGHAGDAVLALPLASSLRNRLYGSLQLSRMSRPSASRASELPPVPDSCEFAPGTLVIAEIGDLLYEVGLGDAGRRSLREAAEGGFVPAWGALTRWQLRAGDENADHTLDTLAHEPALRQEAVSVLLWLVARNRLADAVELRRQLAPAAVAVPEEIAARLSLLRALARTVDGVGSESQE
jgi:hypothetical protein